MFTGSKLDRNESAQGLVVLQGDLGGDVFAVHFFSEDGGSLAGGDVARFGDAIFIDDLGLGVNNYGVLFAGGWRGEGDFVFGDAGNGARGRKVKQGVIAGLGVFGGFLLVGFPAVKANFVGGAHAATQYQRSDQAEG